MLFHTLRKALLVMTIGAAFAAPSSAHELPSTIYIPKIGLYTHLTTSLNEGPELYWWDDDTVAIAGHRTTYARPFAHLDQLRPGDLIRVQNKNFRVVRTLVIRPTETWVLNWKGVVLSACTPPGSAAYRLVVLAKQV